MHLTDLLDLLAQNGKLDNRLNYAWTYANNTATATGKTANSDATDVINNDRFNQAKGVITALSAYIRKGGPPFSYTLNYTAGQFVFTNLKPLSSDLDTAIVPLRVQVSGIPEGVTVTNSGAPVGTNATNSIITLSEGLALDVTGDPDGVTFTNMTWLPIPDSFGGLYIDFGKDPKNGNKDNQPLIIGSCQFAGRGKWEFQSGGEVSADFINIYEEPGIPFSFLKTDRNGTPLGGVTFKLFACGFDGEGEHGHTLMVSNDPSCCWVALENSTATSNSAGKVVFEDLLLPTGDYMLVETETKAGFQLPFGQWKIQVNVKAPEGEQFTITGVTDSNSPPPAFFYNAQDELTVMNYLRFTLPRSGISSYTLLLSSAGGAALLGVAGFVGFSGIRRRKKSKAAR